VSRRYDISIDEGRGAFRRMLAMGFCSLAVAFNLLCGIALSARPAPIDLQALALERGWNVICSAAGMIVVDDAGNRVPDDQTGGVGAGGPHCVFCLPLMQGHVTLAAPHDFVAPVLNAQLLRASPERLLPAPGASSSEAWPRGPPLVLIG